MVVKEGKVVAMVVNCVDIDKLPFDARKKKHRFNTNAFHKLEIVIYTYRRL